MCVFEGGVKCEECLQKKRVKRKMKQRSSAWAKEDLRMQRKSRGEKRAIVNQERERDVSEDEANHEPCLRLSKLCMRHAER